MALQALAKAVDGGSTVPEPLLHDPWLAPLRNHPRFAETLRRAQARRDEALAVFRAEGGEAAARGALGGLTPPLRFHRLERRDALGRQRHRLLDEVVLDAAQREGTLCERS